MEQLSGISRIINEPENPIDLLKEFIEEARQKIGAKTVVMNLATISKDCGVANRNVVYRGLFGNDIVFITERSSKKYEEINEDHRVATTFLFTYKEGERFVVKQVRIKGYAYEFNVNNKEEKDQIEKYWKEETVMAKIRNHICKCGEPVNWENLKTKHDEILDKVKKGEEKFEKPTNSYTAFRVVPNNMDFYYSADRNEIADRIIYKKKENSWTKGHVCA